MDSAGMISPRLPSLRASIAIASAPRTGRGFAGEAEFTCNEEVVEVVGLALFHGGEDAGAIGRS